MTNDTANAVRTSDIVSKRLAELKDTSGLTFRQMAALDEFHGIPPGTLCAIYKGAEVPRKWRRRLGLPEIKPAPACPDCGEVHTVDGMCRARKVVIYQVTAAELEKVERPVVVVRQPRDRPRRLRDYPVDELRKMLENRFAI
jgi:hypothetical protein